MDKIRILEFILIKKNKKDEGKKVKRKSKWRERFPYSSMPINKCGRNDRVIIFHCPAVIDSGKNSSISAKAMGDGLTRNTILMQSWGMSSHISYENWPPRNWADKIFPQMIKSTSPWRGQWHHALLDDMNWGHSNTPVAFWTKMYHRLNLIGRKH